MLSNWRKYLDWEEKESTTADPARVIKLYERCLIAACYYSEFWLRYTKWLETNRSVPDARSVFVRATSIFLVKRYEQNNYLQHRQHIFLITSILIRIIGLIYIWNMPCSRKCTAVSKLPAKYTKI